MTDLITLSLIAVVLAWCADHILLRPIEPVPEEGVRHRQIFLTIVIIILLAGFAGLRTRCNDTGAYKHGYELLNTDGYLESLNKSIGSNPLFNLINCFLKLCNVSTQNFLMFWAFLTVGCYVAFCHRFAESYALSVFLLCTTGAYTFCFAGIKQAAAVGLALVGVMFYLRGHKIAYLIFIAVATGIHPYSLMYLLVPAARYRPWTRNTYILLAASLLGGFMLRPLLGTIVNITTLLGEEYSVASFSEEGVNVFRVIVCNVSTVLSFLYRGKLFRDSTPEENLMVNLTMLNGAIMFVGLFGTANYFARLANYFLLFQCISLPWMLKKIGGKDGRILTALMIAGYVGYFWYGNVIAIPFDSDFARMSVSEYFKMLGR